MKFLTTACFLLCHLALAAQQQRPARLVVLTFDDAARSHYTYVAPLLKKYGFGATFYVCEFPPDYPDTTKYMSWSDIQQLSQWGFEIGNHTWHHTHVNRVSEDSLHTEVAYIEAQCVARAIPRPVSFAYPAYVTGGASAQVLKSSGYWSARIGGDRPYNPATDPPYAIPSYTMKAGTDSLMQAALAQADSGKIVVFTIHGVPDVAHDWVTTPPAMFEKYMQWLYDHHYTVVSMKRLFMMLGQNKAAKGD